jgi:hypothetical protein
MLSTRIVTLAVILCGYIMSVIALDLAVWEAKLVNKVLVDQPVSASEVSKADLCFQNPIS